jgi:amino acid adenylation domain-containing protein
MVGTFLLQTYLHDPVSHSPEKIAVTDGSRSLSYRDLSVLSNKIAHSLKSMGAVRQDRVAICLQRSVNSLSSILGVLKADAIYVPLDQKAPPVRWAHIIEDAAPKVLICDSKTVSVAREALARIGVTIPIMVLCNSAEIQEEIAGDIICLETIESCDASEPIYANNQNDIAYILYTSGSTGRPKGVMISHANVKIYMNWAIDHFNISAEDNILGTAPFHFDMSTFDIYCALKSGAMLCIAGEIQTLFPEKLVKFIEQHQVTLWKGVSSLLMYMSRTGALKEGAMPRLRQVLFAGETLPTKYLIDWMTTFPEKTFYNAYGPTEATGVSTCYRIDSVPDSAHARIPIGVPRCGTRTLLLADNHTEVSFGEVGELCIVGDGLAKGYLNDPEKTAKAFVESPLSRCDDRIYKTGDLARLLPDGNLEYLGRKDRQLKFMGYRIEAGEIEQALLAMPHIKDTVVALMESRLSEGLFELAAFWEAEGEVDVAVISAELKKRLPSYMIPKRFIRVEKMPRCDRGKIMLEALKNNYQAYEWEQNG